MGHDSHPVRRQVGPRGCVRVLVERPCAWAWAGVSVCWLKDHERERGGVSKRLTREESMHVLVDSSDVP